MSATRNKYLNLLIALLIIASLLLLVKPCYFAEDDSTSVMGYIGMVSYHDGVTALFEEAYPDFALNGQVWMPLIMFLVGLGALYTIIARRNMTDGLLLPMFYSIFGIITCWTNQLTRFGGVTVLPTLILGVVFVLCLFNGNWLAGSGESSWAKDPEARSKMKEIRKAAAKKNIDRLAAYAQSQDAEVRTAAIEAMAQVGGSAAFQPLIAQLSCPNPDIRIAAADALSKLGDPRGRSFILHYMESDPDSRVRSAMQKSLAALPSQGA